MNRESSGWSCRKVVAVWPSSEGSVRAWLIAAARRSGEAVRLSAWTPTRVRAGTASQITAALAACRQQEAVALDDAARCQQEHDDALAAAPARPRPSPRASTAKPA